MNFNELNPFIRFAQIIHYASSGTETYIRDCRIFYVLSGTAVIHFQHQEYHLVPNSIFYTHAGSVYHVSSPGVDLISLNFDLTQARCNMTDYFFPIPLTSACDLSEHEKLHIADCPFLNEHILISDGLQYHDQLKLILKEFAVQKHLYKEKCSALLKIILLQMSRQSNIATTPATKAVRIILEEIEKNPNSDLSNQHFSVLTGYHEYHLNRLFVQHTGFTIHQYILNARIVRAKQLLLSTDMPLSEIAEAVGFNSSTYFSSYFKQLVGISPRDFRNNYKKGI